MASIAFTWLEICGDKSRISELHEKYENIFISQYDMHKNTDAAVSSSVWTVSHSGVARHCDQYVIETGK